MKRYYFMVLIASAYLIAVTAATIATIGKERQQHQQLIQTAQNDRAKAIEELSTLCSSKLYSFSIEEGKISGVCGE